MDINTPDPRFKPIYNQMTHGFLPAIVNGARQAGVFSALETGAASARTLAERLSAHPAILSALLDVLTAAGLLDHDGVCFRLAPCAAAFLLDTSPLSQVREIQAFVRHPGPFDNLATRLETGAPPYNPAIFFDKAVIRDMEQRTRGGQLREVVEFIGALPEFQDLRLMCDFAGSSGYYSEGLLEENPHLRSKVYDSPQVAALARKTAADRQTGERLSFIGMDMEAGRNFGRGYDLFFVSHFLYHWGFQGRLSRFFKQVNRAMQPGGFFVSNHTCKAVEKDDYTTQCIIELLARTQGYPTLSLEPDTLMSALALAGFGEFRIRPAKNGTYLNNMLLSAKKIKEI